MKKIAVSVIAAALLLAGCAGNQNDSSSEQDSPPAESTSRPDDSGSVKLKDYSAPDFLENALPADVLSDVVERKFDPAELLVEPEKQPFEGYKCTGVFNGMCYVFKKNGYYGILSSNGKVLLKPNGITKITAVGTSLLAVKYEDKPREYYRVDPNGIYKTEIGAFDKSRITFETVSGGSDSNEHYSVRVDGEDVSGRTWLKYTEISPDSLDTDQHFEAVYYAENADGGFYLAFDSLYNLTICRAECGYAEIRIGELYGDFYITDPNDLTELNDLISSFGDDSDPHDAPKSDKDSDYVRIVIGRKDSGDRSCYTISPEGYCFTEIYRSDKSAKGDSRYFRKLDPETFTDLVYWVNITLGEKTENRL